MFDGLVAFFVGIWNGIKWLFNAVWTWTHNIWVWLLAALLATFHAFKHASEFVVWAINQLPALTSLFAAHSTTSSAATTHWAGYFAEHSNGLACVCNTVFPFDELAGMIVTVLGVWGVALLYRLIKSWLPTLA